MNVIHLRKEDLLRRFFGIKSYHDIDVESNIDRSVLRTFRKNRSLREALSSYNFNEDGRYSLDINRSHAVIYSLKNLFMLAVAEYFSREYEVPVIRIDNLDSLKNIKARDITIEDMFDKVLNMFSDDIRPLFLSIKSFILDESSESEAIDDLYTTLVEWFIDKEF